MPTDSCSLIFPDAKEAATRYAAAKPFPHISFDDFLPDDFARDLLQHFPAFDRDRAKDELGHASLKVTNERLSGISPAYARLEKILSSPEFLAWLSEVTGIPNLLFDPTYFGGGTHENLPGQEISPHVDFNMHPKFGWFRRLNFLLYLNPEWKNEWGGSIDLHENPWKPSKDRVVSFTPSWNRLVIFTTSDISWHGFQTVKNPENRPGFSRKSIAAYFYTKEPPPHGIRFHHSTIYCERPFPATFRPGEVVSPADFAEVERLTARRDEMLQFLYERELHFSETNLSQIEARRKLELELARALHFEGDYYDLLASHEKMKAVYQADHSALLASFREKVGFLETMIETDLCAKDVAPVTLLRAGPGEYTVANGVNTSLRLWSGCKVRATPLAAPERGDLCVVPLRVVLGGKAEAGQFTILQFLGRRGDRALACHPGGKGGCLFSFPLSALSGKARERLNWFEEATPLPEISFSLTMKQRLLASLANPCHKVGRVLVLGALLARGRFLSRKAARAFEGIARRLGLQLCFEA